MSIMSVCDIDGLWSPSATKSGKQMTGQAGITANCTLKPTCIIVSNDPAFYQGRPVRYGKKWSVALWWHLGI